MDSLGGREKGTPFPQGKRERLVGEKGKGKPAELEFDLDLTRQRHRAYARTTRNETISRLGINLSTSDTKERQFLSWKSVRD